MEHVILFNAKAKFGRQTRFGTFRDLEIFHRFELMILNQGFSQFGYNTSFSYTVKFIHNTHFMG